MQRLPLAWTRSGRTEWETEVERASSSLEFRSSAPVNSRALQVANGGNGDGKDCLRAVKTRQSRPGFPRLAIGAANHKSSCFPPQRSRFRSPSRPCSLSLLTKPVHSRPSYSPLYPTDRQSTPAALKWPPPRAICAAYPQLQPRSPLLVNLAPRRRSTVGYSSFQAQSSLLGRSAVSRKIATPTLTVIGRGPPTLHRARPQWSPPALSPRSRPFSSQPPCAVVRLKHPANQFLTTLPSQRL